MPRASPGFHSSPIPLAIDWFRSDPMRQFSSLTHQYISAGGYMEKTPS